MDSRTPDEVTKVRTLFECVLYTLNEILVHLFHFFSFITLVLHCTSDTHHGNRTHSLQDSSVTPVRMGSRLGKLDDTDPLSGAVVDEVVRGLVVAGTGGLIAVAAVHRLLEGPDTDRLIHRILLVIVPEEANALPVVLCPALGEIGRDEGERTVFVISHA